MAKSSRQQFLEAFQTEHVRTMNVLRAYPDDQSTFQPHERSRTAMDVAMPLVLGIERLMVTALTTGFDWSKPPGPLPPPPASMSELTERMEAGHRAALAALEAADDAVLEGTVQFFTGPQTLGDVQVLDFLWFLLFDHIHHRGQLSVYLRMVAQVPSIYGPSGDQPWR